jgi:hypothetical protein
MPFEDMETDPNDFQMEFPLEVQRTSDHGDGNGLSQMSIDLTMVL